MKIHGQNLSAILLRLPWQYQLLTGVGAAFILLTAVHVASVLRTVKDKAFAPVTKPVTFYFSDRPKGVLDPSLAARPHGLTAWMAFTAQDEQGGTGATMNVRLAAAQVTSRGCAWWSEQPHAGLTGKTDKLLAPDGQTVIAKGAWRVETPSLVYDPDDKGKEWKLFAFKYFWADDPQHRLAIVQHYGVIAYSAAPAPDKDWSTEEWLFAAKKNYPPAPYDQLVLLDLDRLSPQLQDVVMYARPSAIYQDGVLALALSAFREGETEPDRVILIVSRDNGNSWLYAGTLLDKKGLSAFDAKGRPPYTRIFGATLLQQDGQVYLAAALGTAARRGAGTLIFAVDDLASGKLRADPKTGAPEILRRVPLPVAGAGPVGGGTAAYTDACPRTGLVISEQEGASSYFKIYQTGIPPAGLSPP
ncbi:MAG: hypothetical protein KGQ70_07095 [Alphaproteobacteria bacterium]|nr:hypothetical protein [Alphaproteobacteria bacterium]